MVDLVYGKLLLPVVGAACETSAPEGLGIAESEPLAAPPKPVADPAPRRLSSRTAPATDSVCVCDIQNVGVAQSTVSHHLRKLREAGLIESERRGSWVHYRAVPGGLAGLRTVVDLESQPVS